MVNVCVRDRFLRGVRFVVTTTYRCVDKQQATTLPFPSPPPLFCAPHVGLLQQKASQAQQQQQLQAQQAQQRLQAQQQHQLEQQRVRVMCEMK